MSPHNFSFLVVGPFASTFQTVEPAFHIFSSIVWQKRNNNMNETKKKKTNIIINSILKWSLSFRTLIEKLNQNQNKGEAAHIISNKQTILRC